MNRKAKYFLVISLFALAAFVAVGLGTTQRLDWPFAQEASIRAVRNLSGPFGSLLAFFCIGLLGRVFAWFFPIGLAVFGFGLAADRLRSASRLLLKTAVILVLLNSLLALVSFTRDSDLFSGAVGATISATLSSLLGRIGGTIILITCLLLVLLREIRFLGRFGTGLLRNKPDWRPLAHGLGRLMTWVVMSVAWVSRAISRAVARVWRRIQEARAKRSVPPSAEVPVEETVVRPTEVQWVETVPDSEPEPVASRPKARPARKPPKTVPKRPATESEDGMAIPLDEAVLPKLELLGTGVPGGSGFSQEKLKTWSDVLEEKLSNYGIEGRVTAVNQGPLVTTFEFAPAPGVKIKDIVSRTDDLALAMRARSLRLIAPIPGRAVVGIEIPNSEQNVVYLVDVLKEIPDRQRLSGIMIAVGVDAVGKPFCLNLCSAPHLLMAGTTGSGKSVSLNCFLASILFQYYPSDVRLLLVDPKMVEMSIYNGIPHLLHPVINDPKEAVRVFTYLIGEMERRNELFRKNGVKNIESYNSKVALGRTGPGESPGESGDKLPYIVMVVDELGDLVLSKGADIESLLSRLSNMARAVGIHMIVATQRPSVDVIVGKTKANFPTRIAFRVASKVDSRTILDCIGADKLIGKGDMLFVDAKHPEALRLHGAWISEEELEKLVAHWRQYSFEESQLDLFEVTTTGMTSGDTDPLFEDAKDIVIQYNQGSTSLLQRKLHVGYARAARLLDQLEQAGIVGPPDGSKPREVLIREEAEVGTEFDDDSD
ncbi:MAG: DNA translocase FtsK 4TM domain-containing protein [Candidatus Latescibacterota bacterium]|nr:MAG: DNA translocase FtsK 4TM domain-containing protein [Candidatus Latescibacterota bacterium]